jgi:hypothetical protein
MPMLPTSTWNWSPEDIEGQSGAYESVAWETWSSTPENQRWRVVLPFETPVPVDIYAGVHSHFGLLAGDDLGRESGKPAQIWYLRSRRPGGADGAVLRSEGQCIEPLDYTGLAPTHAPAALENQKSIDMVRAWNDTHNVGDILTEHSYELIQKGRKADQDQRPGSTSSSAAAWVYHDTGHCFADSGGDPLGGERRHDAFDCMRILGCEGSWPQAFRKAEKALGRDNGFTGLRVNGKGEGEGERVASDANLFAWTNDFVITDAMRNERKQAMWIIPNVINERTYDCAGRCGGRRKNGADDQSCSPGRERGLSGDLRQRRSCVIGCRVLHRPRTKRQLQVFAADLAGQSMEGVIDHLRVMAESNRDLSGIVVVLDTLKKCTEVIQKSSYENC